MGSLSSRARGAGRAGRRGPPRCADHGSTELRVTQRVEQPNRACFISDPVRLKEQGDGAPRPSPRISHHHDPMTCAVPGDLMTCIVSAGELGRMCPSRGALPTSAPVVGAKQASACSSAWRR